MDPWRLTAYCLNNRNAPRSSVRRANPYQKNPYRVVRTGGLEPPRLSTPDPKSGAATITPRAPLYVQRYDFFLYWQNGDRARHSRCRRAALFSGKRMQALSDSPRPPRIPWHGPGWHGPGVASTPRDNNGNMPRRHGHAPHRASGILCAQGVRTLNPEAPSFLHK